MACMVAEAVASVAPVESLRWITFGHVEADECGSMNMWLAAAPDSAVAHGALGCAISLNDLCDRPPRALDEGEVIDLGGKRVRQISTPHVPHGWEAQVLFEETTGTLLCGDLFSQIGSGAALTTQDLVEPAMTAEAMFHATSEPRAPHSWDLAGARRAEPRDPRHHARLILPGRRQASPVRLGRLLREVDGRRMTSHAAAGRTSDGSVDHGDVQRGASITALGLGALGQSGTGLTRRLQAGRERPSSWLVRRAYVRVTEAMRTW